MGASKCISSPPEDRMRRLGFALVGAMLLASVVLAQLKVDVALVNVVATVTDDRGQYVPDLTADDFIVKQ
jgi:hypothetical protein